MLHCTFAECTAKRTSRNCSGCEKELAVRGTSQNRHRDNEGHWDTSVPCQKYLLGWAGDKRRLSSSLGLPRALLSHPKPGDSVLPPSASLIFSFPLPQQERRQNSPSKGGLWSLISITIRGCDPPEWEEVLPSLKLPLLSSTWEKMGHVGEN